MCLPPSGRFSSPSPSTATWLADLAAGHGRSAADGSGGSRDRWTRTDASHCQDLVPKAGLRLAWLVALVLTRSGCCGLSWRFVTGVVPSGAATVSACAGASLGVPWGPTPSGKCDLVMKLVSACMQAPLNSSNFALGGDSTMTLSFILAARVSVRFGSKPIGVYPQSGGGRPWFCWLAPTAEPSRRRVPVSSVAEATS